MGRSTGYIIGFAAAVCLVCAIVVASSAVALKERQDVNKALDRKLKVLNVAGLVAQGESPEAAAIEALFAEKVEPKLVDLDTGEYVDATKDEVLAFDQLKASKDPAMSSEAPKNGAGVKRVPNSALVYLVEAEGKQLLVLPIEGKGLWSTLYGFLALENDANTVAGLTFYQHGETPGLGGEVDNPKWKSLWPGRKIFGDDGAPKIDVIKGAAGPPAEAPYAVDGLSGATITGRGVGSLLRFWMGEDGFKPYLTRYAKGEGA